MEVEPLKMNEKLKNERLKSFFHTEMLVPKADTNKHYPTLNYVSIALISFVKSKN